MIVNTSLTNIWAKPEILGGVGLANIKLSTVGTIGARLS